MTSREIIQDSLNHKHLNRVPLDLGSSSFTGMHVNTVYGIRQALGLDKPGTPVKVIEPYQMLGEIKPDLVDAFGIDVVGLKGTKNMFGFRNEGWKEWTNFQDVPVLVPSAFNVDLEPNGDIFMYPEGDKSVGPSGRMPRKGWFFDAIIRQAPIDKINFNVDDNLNDFGLISDNDLNYFKSESERLYTETDKAILATFGGTSFGDIALVPAPWLKNPKGIRDVEEWYISLVSRPDYVYRIFEHQCAVALANLEKLYKAVGNKITAIVVTGTDFGSQTGTIISIQAYRDLFKPFHLIVNRWIHEHTQWKTFMHSCGAIKNFIEDFIDAGFDILNPVQCSAFGMDPAELKAKFGDRIVFWGGGSDTQRTLPFGTPFEVCEEAKKRIEVFMNDGGFVFSTVHNIQAGTPIQNIIALFTALRSFK